MKIYTSKYKLLPKADIAFVFIASSVALGAEDRAVVLADKFPN